MTRDKSENSKILVSRPIFAMAQEGKSVQNTSDKSENKGESKRFKSLSF